MPTALAHAVGGAPFPVPLWAIGYGAAAVLVLLAVALRWAWPTARLGPDAADAADAPASTGTDPGPVRRVLVVVGQVGALLLWAITVTAAFVGPDDNAVNITSYAVVTALLLGGTALSLVAGDVWRAVNPLDTLAVLVFGRRLPERTARRPPAWAGGALLASYAWVTTAFHLRISPRALGVWLVAYTALALAGAAAWGRRWLRDGEGFAALFGLLARLSPWRRLTDPADRSGDAGDGTDDHGDGAAATTAVALVAASIPLFDAARQFSWWTTGIVGDRGDWARTFIHTIGLAFTIAVLFLLWSLATRAAAAHGADTGAWLPALVVLLGGLLVARYAVAFVVDGTNFLALLSDPYARGWDVLGTVRWLPPTWVGGSSWFAWIEVLAIVLAAVVAVVVAHDRSLATTGSRRAAAAAAVPVHGVLVVVAVAGIGLVLGG